MKLHVLVGCRELLLPEFLAPQAAESLIGPKVRVAKAYWIAPRCGDHYHSFLQVEPEDRRTKVMALALRDGFGTRSEPLLILPNLLNEVEEDPHRLPPGADMEQRSQLAVLSDILACGFVKQLHLYGLALPNTADPEGLWAVPTGIVPGSARARLCKLRSLSDIGPDVTETTVIEATPDLPVCATLYNNSLCNYLVSRLVPRLRDRGWSCQPEALAAAVFRMLSSRNTKGLFVSLPLCSDHLDAMTDLVYEKLL